MPSWTARLPQLEPLLKVPLHAMASPSPLLLVLLLLRL
jgi:hypothetical protein